MGLIKRFKTLKTTVVLILLSLYLTTFAGWVYSVNAYDAKPTTLQNLELGEFDSIFVPQNYTAEIVNALKIDQEKIIKEEEIMRKAESVERLMARFNSPMAGYGELIVRRSEECGGDYKIITAIAGNESGFGRIPYKLYNPFGYLDGVQYSGWEEAIYVITCKISERFIKPCNGDLVCIVRTYGGSDTDKEKWVRNIRWFISQL